MVRALSGTPSVSIRKISLSAASSIAAWVATSSRLQVENLAGGGIADGRQQHDVVLVEPSADCGGVDFAYFAGMQQVDAVAHPQRPRGDEIARGDADAGAGHRRVGQPERQQRFDLDPYRAGGFFHARQRGVVGDAQAFDIANRGTVFVQPCFHLWPHAMDQHQAHAQAVQQVDVVCQLHEITVGHEFATECDDKRFATKTMDVGCGGTEPVDEIGRVFQGNGLNG